MIRNHFANLAPKIDCKAFLYNFRVAITVRPKTALTEKKKINKTSDCTKYGNISFVV